MTLRQRRPITLGNEIEALVDHRPCEGHTGIAGRQVVDLRQQAFAQVAGGEARRGAVQQALADGLGAARTQAQRRGDLGIQNVALTGEVA